mgnify:CR=1 FL=1
MFQKIIWWFKIFKKNEYADGDLCGEQDPEAIYKQLLALEKLIRTDGEQAWYDLNRAALLYDMRKLNAAAE